MCERGRKGLPVMCAGQFGVVGIHSGCANGHIDGAGVALGVTVRRADYDRRRAARVAAAPEKLERVDTIECPLIAAERFGDGSLPVAQTGFGLTGDVEECRVDVGVIGGQLQSARATVGQSTDRPPLRIGINREMRLDPGRHIEGEIGVGVTAP